MLMRRSATGTFLVILSILLVLSAFSISDRTVLGSEEAKLGYALGSVLLRWNLISSGLVSAGEDSAREPLESSLDRLEEALDSTGFPADLCERVKPLRTKLEAAKERKLWTIQLGYWSFGEEDSSVTLSGADRESINEEARFQSYRYLEFSEEDDRVMVDITEKSLPESLEKFMVGLWMDPGDPLTGTPVGGANWSLVLRDGEVVLEHPGGTVPGKELTHEYWTHVALVTDGDTVKLYQNGLPTGEADLSEPLKISSELELGSGFIGKLDELRVKQEKVNPEEINFDRPMDYLLGFPVIERVNENFESEETWNFYAGLLLSSLTVKGDSKVATVKVDDLKDVSDFLLGNREGLPEPPDSFPESGLADIKELGRLGELEELSEGDREEVEKLLESLVSYLDPL